MKTQRQLKGEAILQKAITEIIGKSFGFVASVAAVELSPDFKHAKIYLTKLSNDCNFEIVTKTIRSKLGKTIDFRSTPKLDFALNEVEDIFL